MTTRHWLDKHARALTGKTVAVTGSTGGLGRELCHDLAQLGASLVLLDRNPDKAAALRQELTAAYPSLSLRQIRLNLEDMDSVRAAVAALEEAPPDVLIHNAGAYAIPRHTCSTGYDNVFQIDCASPYCMTRMLLPALRRQHTRVVVVGSIAHRYSPTDPADVDFSSRAPSHLVYGNAKRRLMFGFYELFRKEREVSLAVVHPGIAFTNITAHYPPWLFAIIKYPMKVLFMSPRRAALSILAGVFEPCDDGEWIGPWLFDVWGLPRKSRLRSCPPAERRQIGKQAEEMWRRISSQAKNAMTE